jgi:hypothetical protein
MLYEVWGSAPDTLYAVGYASTVLRYDGQQWNSVPPPPSSYLGRIWGTDGENMYVGATDSLYHFDGLNWKNTGINVRSNVWSISGSSRDDVWVSDGTNWLWHYNGLSWTNVITHVNYPFTNLWSLAPDNVFGVGTDGFVSHFDGVTWSEHSLGDFFLLSVWPVGQNDVWVGGLVDRGTGGVLFHFDGTWSQTGDTLADALQDVWCSPAGNRAFAVGLHGETLQKRDDVWRVLDSKTTVNLHAVWGSATGEAIAVGEQGTCLRFDGESWNPVDLNTTASLTDVWGASMADVYVGSHDGLWHLDGDAWEHSRSHQLISSVWGTSGSNVYTAGMDSLYEKGVVQHFGGGGWQTIYAEPNVEIGSLTGTTNGVVLAAFYDRIVGRTLLGKYESGAWVDITPPPVTQLTALAASDDFGLVIAGHNMDGAAWTDLGVFRLGNGEWLQLDPTYGASFGGAWGGLDEVYLVGGSAIVRCHD